MASRNNGWHLGPEDSFQLTASKKLGTSAIQLQENEFCQQYEWAWKRGLPQSSLQMKMQLSQYLDCRLVTSWAENPTALNLESWDPQKLGDNKRVLFETIRFEVLCYTAIKNKTAYLAFAIIFSQIFHLPVSSCAPKSHYQRFTQKVFKKSESAHCATRKKIFNNQKFQRIFRRSKI